MYSALIFYHSLFRWLVFGSLLVAVFLSASGLRSGRPFSRMDNLVRHWTATLAHVQLVLGILLYTQSPVVHYFWKHFREAATDGDNLFFGLLHLLLMLTAIIVLTIASAKAKREQGDLNKFRTMFRWYGSALLVILIAVPWPFSPFAARPYFR